MSTISDEWNEQDDLFEHHRIKVDSGQSALRVDKFLNNRLHGISRNRIQNAAEAGSIIVNGVPVKSSYRVRPADIISIVLAHPPRDVEIYPDEIPLDIIYEDEHLIVINKKPGMVVHPAYGNYRKTLINALAHYLNPDLKDQPLKVESIRPGLVHRIDKNTSGLIVIAKNESAMTHLANQFFNRTIQRKYISLVWGDFLEDQGTITGNIGRNLKNRKIMQVFPESNYGKHAVTHYSVLERFGFATLLECRLETGRTHQIRIHFSHLGHPLFNDSEYGGNKIIKGNRTTRFRQFIELCFQICPRQALHAKSLGFIHPATSKMEIFDTFLPDDMKLLLEQMRSD